MYTHHQEPFGRFEKHVIENSAGGNRMTFVPGKGGGLLELSFGGTNVIQGFLTPDALDRNSGANSMPLFPFPSRLAGGTYEWRGRVYQFPLTDKAGPNAIHGFGRHSAMEVAAMELGAGAATVTLSYDYPGDKESYPFPFRFTMTYRLRDGATFELEMSVTNRHDQPIPFGFGWHPYFLLDSRADNVRLQLPPCERIEVDEHLIPTGRRTRQEHFIQRATVGNFALNNCFALLEPHGRPEVLLSGDRGTLRIWQEAGPGKFNYIVVYIPDGRDAIAVEPMTCNIDAFHNGDGLIVLQPGETAGARCGVVFE